ncbi:MAG: hypothetical protein IK066_02925 [Kiritimatiellae bacterium]|nr:hypothetical protein [Kiritimatiellia bacterium]
MADITSNPIALSQTWGVAFCDYTMGDSTLDFQDLMVAVAEKRAVTVEGEVAPLTTHIRMRNAELDTLGSILAAFTKLQSNFGNDDSGDTKKTMGNDFQEAWIDLANMGSVLVGQGDHSTLAYWQGDFKKSDVEGLVSQYKSMIDGRNNAAQSDMSRLQSLVDRRDESYSTATNLMSSVSDTRANLIHNL